MESIFVTFEVSQSERSSDVSDEQKAKKPLRLSEPDVLRPERSADVTFDRL